MVGLLFEAFDDCRREIDHVDHLWIIRQPAIVGLGDVEQVLEKSPQVLGCLVRFGDKFVRFGIDCCCSGVERQTQIAFDRRYWRTHFVASCTDKLCLRPLFFLFLGDIAKDNDCTRTNAPNWRHHHLNAQFFARAGLQVQVVATDWLIGRQYFKYGVGAFVELIVVAVEQLQY